MQYLPYCLHSPPWRTRTVSLKSLRTEAGLSQNELGQRLSRSMPSDAGRPNYYQPRISAYENGRNSMPLPVALALVKILNKALKKAGSKKVATVELLGADKKKARS